MIDIRRHNIALRIGVFREIIAQHCDKPAALHPAPACGYELGGHAADDGLGRNGRHVLAYEAVGCHDGLVGNDGAAGYRRRVAYPAVVAYGYRSCKLRHDAAAEVGHEVEIGVKYLTSVHNPGLCTDPYFRVRRDVAKRRDFRIIAHVEHATLAHVYLICAANLARATEYHLAPDVQLGVSGRILRPAGYRYVQAHHAGAARPAALHGAELAEQFRPPVDEHGQAQGLAQREKHKIEIQRVKRIKPMHPQGAHDEH